MITRRYLIVSDSIISRRRCNKDKISYMKKIIHFQIYPTIALMHTSHIRYVYRPESLIEPPWTPDMSVADL